MNAHDEIDFISDIQNPIWIEEIILKEYRNKEASDTLISDIVKRKPKALFMLGDILSNGYSADEWNKIDKMLLKLRKSRIYVYSVPGNHEYEFVPKIGKKNFEKSFPYVPIAGYSKVIDSIGIVMLNSNFGKITKQQYKNQLAFYDRIMDSLNKSNGIKFIIVACHHPPFTNSTIVRPNEDVQKLLIPKFEKTEKALLFLSGHSHNLEYFVNKKKNYLVIGGGGGLKQPLLEKGYRKYKDEIDNGFKPLYFYIKVTRNGNELTVSSRGIDKSFIFSEREIFKITTEN